MATDRKLLLHFVLFIFKGDSSTYLGLEYIKVYNLWTK